jgi:hypothetical protein
VGRFSVLDFFPAPAALGNFLHASLLDDAWSQGVMAGQNAHLN